MSGRSGSGRVRQVSARVKRQQEDEASEREAKQLRAQNDTKRQPAKPRQYAREDRVSCWPGDFGEEYLADLAAKIGRDAAHKHREEGTVQGPTKNDSSQVDVLWDVDGTIMAIHPSKLRMCAARPRPSKLAPAAPSRPSAQQAAAPPQPQSKRQPGAAKGNPGKKQRGAGKKAAAKTANTQPTQPLSAQADIDAATKQLDTLHMQIAHARCSGQFDAHGRTSLAPSRTLADSPRGASSPAPFPAPADSPPRAASPAPADSPRQAASPAPADSPRQAASPAPADSGSEEAPLDRMLREGHSLDEAHETLAGLEEETAVATEAHAAAAAVTAALHGARHCVFSQPPAASPACTERPPRRDRNGR